MTPVFKTFSLRNVIIHCYTSKTKKPKIPSVLFQNTSLVAKISCANKLRRLLLVGKLIYI